MKKLTLLIAVLLSSLLLSGCAFTDWLSNLNSDTISGWLFKVTEVELDDVKTAQEIKDSLPTELSTLVVDKTALDCEVAHLAIRSRSTDTTRRTDQVECEVEVSGDGISVSYVCTLNYTYTTNGGWSLDNWSLDSSALEMNISEGELTEQLTSSTIESLEAELGEGTVSYLSSSWDQKNLVCSVVLDINACNSCLITQGEYVVTATLTPNLSSGLNFTWKVTEDNSGIRYGLNVTDTTWLVTGYVDTTAVEISLSFSETDIDAQTITVSASTGVLETGYSYYTIRSMENTVLTYSISKTGTITASFKLGNHTWDCCFDSSSQWCRMDSSYIGTMQLQCNAVLTATELRALLDEVPATDESASLDYSNTSSGYTYTSTDGTLVYEMKVTYPQFTGTGVSSLNSSIQSTASSFLGSPKLSTTSSNLDAIAEQSQEEGSSISLPYYSYLEVSVVFNQNHYLSLLYTYTQKLQNGITTYSYAMETYNTETMELISDIDMYTGTVAEIGALLNSYATTARYSDALIFNYVQGWTLTKSGLVFYVTANESTGLCDMITIPYAENLILFDPTD